MQEVEQELGREIVIIIKGVVRLSPRALKTALRAAKGSMKITAKTAALPVQIPGAIKDEIEAHKNVRHHGKQTVRQLARQDKGLASIRVDKATIGDFNRVARKYGVDFAPFKVKGQNTYMVYFKAQDKDALTAAFEEYTKKVKQKAKRPSLRQKLAKLKPIASEHDRSSRPEPVR